MPEHEYNNCDTLIALALAVLASLSLTLSRSRCLGLSLPNSLSPSLFFSLSFPLAREHISIFCVNTVCKNHDANRR